MLEAVVGDDFFQTGKSLPLRRLVAGLIQRTNGQNRLLSRQAFTGGKSR